MVDFKKNFEYENGFYLTADINRFSKFITHYELFKQTSHLRGEIVECGVFKGVSLSRWIKFRSLLENSYSRKIIGFDTFGKFPEAQYPLDKKQRDLFVEEAGENSISKIDLENILSKLELNKNIELIEGDILQSVPNYIVNNPQLKISLLHIDVDLYEPTKIILETLIPYVVKGGIVILDDYGAFAGANKAIDEYFNNNLEIKKLPCSNAISYIKI